MSEVATPETTQTEADPQGSPQGQTDEQAQASFKAGFDAVRNKVHGDEKPTSTSEPQKDLTKDEPTAAQPDGAPAKVDEPEPIVLAGMTESQIKAALAKVSLLESQVTQVRDKTMGKFGEVERILGDLKKGKAPQITGKAFKRLENELGPEIAQAIADDLGEIMGEEPAAKQEPGKTEAPVAATQVDLDAERARFKAEGALEAKHPDWMAKMGSDDFSLWLGVLDPSIKAAVESSSDPAFIHKALDAYGEWKSAADKAKQAAAGKQTRLARATAPQGGGGVVQSVIPDEEGFARGFEMVRKKQRAT